MSDIPTLENWINLTDAAALLGVSRQYAHKLAQQGAFKTLHKIGGSRDVLIVDPDEVRKLATKRSVDNRKHVG